MGNKCFKGEPKDELHLDAKQKNNAQMQNSTQQNSNDPQKNPFKKKRGEGYIPPHLMNDNNDNTEPPQSLATFSLMNQQQPEKPQNDAIVAGTFGGDGNMMQAAQSN